MNTFCAQYQIPLFRTFAQILIPLIIAYPLIIREPILLLHLF